MKRTVTIWMALSALALTLVVGAAPASAATLCDNSGNSGTPVPVGSTVPAGLTVPSGAECTLDNVRVRGTVTQLDHSLLLVKNGSRIDGGIKSTNAWELLLLDTTRVGGSVTVTGIGTDPDYGGGTFICGSIGGALTITGTTVDRYWSIGVDANEGGPCNAGAKLTIGGAVAFDNNLGGGDLFHIRSGRKISCAGNANPLNASVPVWEYDNVTGSNAGPNHDGQLLQCTDV